MRLTRTRPGRAVLRLSRETSSLFANGANDPAIHEEIREYRRAARNYLRTHPDVRSVEVYLSERAGGSLTDSLYQEDIA